MFYASKKYKTTSSVECFLFCCRGCASAPDLAATPMSLTMHILGIIGCDQEWARAFKVHLAVKVVRNFSFPWDFSPHNYAKPFQQLPGTSLLAALVGITSITQMTSSGRHAAIVEPVCETVKKKKTGDTRRIFHWITMSNTRYNTEKAK